MVVALAAFVLLPALVAAADEPAQPAAIVDQFFRALATGDREAASALLDPGVLIFESGGVERSRQDYLAAHWPEDVRFLGSAQQRVLIRDGGASGDLAWVATSARLTAGSRSKPVFLKTTESMILRKSASGWRIVHIHWSSQPAPK